MPDNANFKPLLFGDQEKPVTNELVKSAIVDLQSEGFRINPLIQEIFENENLSNKLAETLSKENLKEFIQNSSRFRDFLNSDEAPTFLGEQVVIPESTLASGNVRRSEIGQRVLLNVISQKGINPDKVLMFRVTSPSDTPKPEYYWTSDFFLVIRGLHEEISPEVRANSVVLVNTLEAINKNQGLIVDVNEDNGQPVRQIGLASFDQQSCLAKIPTASLKG